MTEIENLAKESLSIVNKLMDFNVPSQSDPGQPMMYYGNSESTQAEAMIVISTLPFLVPCHCVGQMSKQMSELQHR